MNLHKYSWVVVNSSAGKDSQTMLHYIVNLAKEQQYPLDQVVVVHANLGAMEWAGTQELAAKQAAHYGLRFEVVTRPQGNLLEQVKNRGMWPSSTTRYCTSDQKRGQVAKVITKLDREVRSDRKQNVTMLNCMGLRAEESPARAKKAPFEINKVFSTKTRTVDTWLPIHDWTEQQVWASIKESGVPHHYAYDLGMPRLSCVFCIFAPKQALILAGQHNRELLDKYVKVEQEIGHLFRQDMPIANIQEAVVNNVTTGPMDGAWNM